MSKIIKSVWPLVVARHDEAHCRRFRHSLNYFHRDPSSAFGSRLSQRTFDDLGPGPLGALILHQVSHCKIAVKRPAPPTNHQTLDLE
jgi:hypothetical protein